ncbi:hypothetical protein B2J93_4891 [Marssonina coronariae]|uniref:Uncharacterized protein n=1 Tax=Diplocarpon coronariae TaxID=2795749 RepID=A0A218ZA24_9HELO|nr:hypothetical protein B2J93_4891 [Marssonina coronariae]
MKSNDLAPPHPPRGCSEESSRDRDTVNSSYFLVRRRTTDSDTVSPKYSPSGSPFIQKPRSQRSRWSSIGPRAKAYSNSDLQSMRTTTQYNGEWNNSSIGLNALSSSGRQVNTALDPPRPPRDGFEWVWFPEGYWAERERRDLSSISSTKQGFRPKWWSRSPERKSKSSGKSGKAESTSKTAPLSAPIELPRIYIGSLISRTSSSSKASKMEPSPSTTRRSSRDASSKRDVKLLGAEGNITIPPYYAIAPGQQLGLYCRTKNTIRTRFQQKADAADDVSVADQQKLASQTTMLLQGTSHFLDRVQREKSQPPGIHVPSDLPQTPGSPGGISLRRFGLAPWHRRSSHESILSASSSVFKLLLGKAPSATPNPEHQYEAHGGANYAKVDIASPDPLEPNFLPSEAKRVNTPPMFPGTPAVQARGFFFDLNSSKDNNASPRSNGSSAGAIVQSKGHPPLLDWWEADTEHTSMGNKSTKAMPKAHSPPAAFELTLPEHFPNSPLCPKNPKHKTGGTGICPYHGRKRDNNLKIGQRIDSEGSGNQYD